MSNDGRGTSGEDTTQQVDKSTRRALFDGDNPPMMTVIAGPALGRRFQIEEKPVVIGRSSEADVQIKDDGISRRHFRLVPKGTDLVVEDLGSSNGTYVNGEEIDRPRRLEEGDNITVGMETALRVSWFETGENFDQAFRMRVKQMREDRERLENELAAAREVQHALLPPQTQQFGRATIEGLYHPSDALSGDFYDVISVDPWVYLYVVDVTSHGVAAAQVTYLLRGSFTQLLQRETLELPELVRSLQGHYREYDIEYDAAFHLCRLHPESGRLEYMRASVVPGFYRHGDGIDVVKAPPSPPLSRMDRVADANVPEPVTLELATGETFIVCTDGCYEFEDAEGRTFGKRRLMGTLADTPDRKWPERLLDSFVRVHGSRDFEDDLTAVRLQLDPPSGKRPSRHVTENTVRKG